MSDTFPSREEISKNYREEILDSLREIDTTKVNFNDSDFKPRTKIVEEQKVYFWIRLYLKEELEIEPNTKVTIKYNESGETLETIFACYNKKGIQKDLDSNLTNYNPDDDKKVLCLLIDSNRINKESEDIPFIRTLFKIGKYYQPQILRHSDLTITNENNDKIVFYDIDF